MMLSHTIQITVTKQQVLDFANLTGDNIALHTEHGVVQSGLILSMLPQWFAIQNHTKKHTLPHFQQN